MSALTVNKEEEKRLKGQGFLNNRGTDEFSARVITVNGKVTAVIQEPCSRKMYRNKEICNAAALMEPCSATAAKTVRWRMVIWNLLLL